MRASGAVLALSVFFLTSCTKPSIATANVDTETTAASSSDGAHIIRTWPQGGDSEEPNPDKFKSIMPLTIVTFTPTGIREFGVQRSKSFIRKTFGTPDSVEEGENSWMYSSDNAHLKVLDEDAGKRVFVRFHFESGAPAEDRVEQVEVF